MLAVGGNLSVLGTTVLDVGAGAQDAGGTPLGGDGLVGGTLNPDYPSPRYTFNNGSVTSGMGAEAVDQWSSFASEVAQESQDWAVYTTTGTHSVANPRITFTGDGSEIAFLDGVGASRADLVIALTADDGANLVTAQVAQHWFKVPRVIARVNDPRNETLFRRLGVDSIVSASGAVMAQIEGIDMSDPHRLASRDADYVALQSLSLDLGILIATGLGGGQGDKIIKTG